MGNWELLALKLARWTLFFTCFGFTLSYCPCSRNVKPDALSRQFEWEDNPDTPATILQSPCVIGAVTWDIVDEIRWALEGVEIPEGCRENCFCQHDKHQSFIRLLKLHNSCTDKHAALWYVMMSNQFTNADSVLSFLLENKQAAGG